MICFLEKHVVGRLSESFYSEDRREKEETHFLAERRRSLEKFLMRIASHSLLRENSDFKAFLEQDQNEWTKTKVGIKCIFRIVSFS